MSQATSVVSCGEQPARSKHDKKHIELAPEWPFDPASPISEDSRGWLRFPFSPVPALADSCVKLKLD